MADELVNSQANQAMGGELPLQLDPITDDVLSQKIAIPYVTTRSTGTPKKNGYREIFFDGSSTYWFRVYANGAWRETGIDGAGFPSGLTHGDVFFVNSSLVPARLAAGTSGQFFKTLGAGADPVWADAARFGGTGADGALSIGSGTTTLDFGGKQFLEKNYTSISITGTAQLAFSNPHANGSVAVLRSQGNVTITSSANPVIDLRNLGGIGGASKTTTGVGLAGTDGVVFIRKCGGGAGGATGPGAFSAGGTRSGGGTESFTGFIDVINRYPGVAVGGGGASGESTNNFDSGAGGRGAGCLVIECGGAYNFTSTNGVNATGANGGNGEVNAGGSGGGGGGGGGGGMFYVIYATLTANSGGVTVTGGSNGTQDDAGTGGGGAGAGADGNASGDGGDGISVAVQNNSYS